MNLKLKHCQAETTTDNYYMGLVWTKNLKPDSYQHKVPILQNFYLNTVKENYEEKNPRKLFCVQILWLSLNGVIKESSWLQFF